MYYTAESYIRHNIYFSYNMINYVYYALTWKIKIHPRRLYLSSIYLWLTIQSIKYMIVDYIYIYVYPYKIIILQKITSARSCLPFYRTLQSLRYYRFGGLDISSKIFFVSCRRFARHNRFGTSRSNTHDRLASV